MMLTGGPALAAKSIRQMVPTAASILPPAVAKTVYENISAGMPVICYHLDGSGSGTTSTTAQNGGAASETKPQQTQPAAETKPQQSQAASNNPSGVHETTAPRTEEVPSHPLRRSRRLQLLSQPPRHSRHPSRPPRRLSRPARLPLVPVRRRLIRDRTVPARALHPQFFIRWSGKRRYIRRHSERTRWSGSSSGGLSGSGVSSTPGVSQTPGPRGLRREWDNYLTK